MGIFSKNKNRGNSGGNGGTNVYHDDNGNRVEITFAPGAKERLGGIDTDALLRDVAGVDTNASTPADEVWKIFDALSEKERRAALGHTFSISNSGYGAGWEYPEVTLDGECYRYRVSYIGPNVAQLAQRVKGLADGGEGKLTWQDEPGAYRWYFARRGNVVYVEIPEADGGVYMDYSSFCKALNAI